MQVEIDGLHEHALLRLMRRNNEKTGIGMIRMLIRDAAKEANVWPSSQEPENELIAIATDHSSPSHVSPRSS